MDFAGHMLPGFVWFVLWFAILAVTGLPIVTAICYYQANRSRAAENSPLAASWLDAAVSLTGMTVAMVLLITIVWWAARLAIETFANLGTS